MNGEPRELVLLGKAARMLAEATTIDEVKHIRDTADVSSPLRKAFEAAARVFFPANLSAKSGRGKAHLRQAAGI